MRLWDSFSRLPEVVLYKWNQNGFLRVLLSCNFYDKDLKRFDRLFKTGVIILDGYAKIGLFCDTKIYWVKGSVERFY